MTEERIGAFVVRVSMVEQRRKSHHKLGDSFE